MARGLDLGRSPGRCRALAVGIDLAPDAVSWWPPVVPAVVIVALVVLRPPSAAVLASASRWPGLPSRTGVVLSGHVSQPILAGILRPTVLLPESVPRALTQGQLEYVLAHELAHALRRESPA